MKSYPGKPMSLFSLHEDNSLAETNGFAESAAWAGLVYSLVPFLGILFVPVGLIASGFAIVSSASDKKPVMPSVIILAATLVIFFLQAGLWSLLYLIPARNAL
jgi:hypothetical protein